MPKIAEEPLANWWKTAIAQGEGARAALRQAVGEGEYFMVVLPDGSRLLHSIGGQRFPIAFGREIAAALAGVPERADWKNCKVRWALGM